MTRFAADRVNNISSFLDDGPAWGEVGARSVMNAAADEVNTVMNNAKTSEAVLMGKGLVARAEANADVTRQVGSLQGQTSAVSGIASGIGGLDLRSAFKPSRSSASSYSFGDFGGSMLSNPFG